MRVLGLPLSLVVLMAMGCRPAPAPDASVGSDGAEAVFTAQSGQWVDLTWALSEATVFWPTADGFELDTVAYGVNEAGYFYSAFNFRSAEHGGTHLDAPIHFAEGRSTTDQIPLDRLIGPAVVVDVSSEVGPDYQVGPGALEAWESEYGTIPDGALLLIRTGWGDRWGDRLSYLGTDLTGPEAVPELHFPGLHPDAAQWLVDNRTVAAIGIDTPSLDYGQSSGYEAHRILYAENIPGFENVAHLDALPPSGAFVVALPAKIEGGSGAPLRIVAFVPNR